MPIDPSTAHHSSGNHHDEGAERIPHTVWLLGFMMFLINCSFIMIFGLSGVYLKSIGVSTASIGLLEGTAEGLSFATKLFSGVISDHIKKRKPIMVLGYGMMVLSKPLFAIAGSAQTLFFARFMERMGNGIQGTPRDALVSDIAPPKKKGASYGLKRTLSQTGSVFGGALGILAMWATTDNYQLVFWLAVIPAFLAWMLLIFFVKDPKKDAGAVMKKREPFNLRNFHRLPICFWLLMVVAALFMLARVNETMIALHAHQNYGLDAGKTPLIMMLYNGTYGLAAYPIGKLSDRMSRYTLLCLTMVVLIVADLFLSLSTTLNGLLMGVAIWGIQMGMAQSLFMALIADMTPKDLRGTSFGCFYLISAIASVLAGFWAGHIAEHYGEGQSFFISAIIAVVSLCVLMVLIPKIKSYRNGNRV